MDIFIPLILHKQFNNVPLIKEINNITDSLDNLTTNDFGRAEHFLFRKIQREAFPIEYKALSTGKPVRNPMMQQLNVFLDPQGLIRINARTNVNKEIFPQQFAPLLPRRNILVTNMLAFYHYKHNHIAMEAQIAEIRTVAWIPELKMALRSIKARCNWCKVKKAMPYSPKMAPLPDDRVDADLRPFEVTGIDILGPLRPTVNGNIKKVYILIFVCTLTRYIHLHILDSMESLRILEAIVTFWTSYGPVRKFISDNASNFKRTAKTLEEDYQREQFFNKHMSALGPKLSEIYRVEWQFIPAHSPWFGGVYERLIKEVKRALSATLERRKISRVELNIAVMEANHRINCRPLTENSLDAADGEILTPHHLVKNKSGWPLLPGIHKNVYSSIPDRSIYRRGRIVADELMRKFTAHYLPVLTKRTKWHKTEVPPKVGDLVLVIEPNKTRREWQRAKIVRIHIGKDGTARVADVRMANGKIKKSRAIRNLAKLELSKSFNDEEANCSQASTFTVGAIIETSTVSSNSNLTSSSKFELSYNVQSEANFRDIYSENNSIENNLNKSIMKRTLSNISTTTRAFSIEGIAANTKCSEIIRAIEPEFNSIIGIFRVRDYEADRNLDSAFIFLLDPAEYTRAVTEYRTVRSIEGTKVSFPSVTLCSAYFKQSIEIADARNINQVPIPISVTNLPRMSEYTSKYVINLLETYEEIARVCGFRWCIENDRIITRTFGFLAVPNRNLALALAGRIHMCNGSPLYANLSDSATILLDEVDANLINTQRKAVLTERVINANRLNAKYNPSDPDLKRITVTFFQKAQLKQSAQIVSPVIQKVSVGTNTDPVVISSVNADLFLPDGKSSDPVQTSRVGSLAAGGPETEDSIVLTLDDAEKFIEEEPCCSKSLTEIDNSTKSNPSEVNELNNVGNNIQEHLTVKINEEPCEKKAKKGRSRFVNMKMIGRYPFTEFQKRCLCFVREHVWILFVEKKESSTIYLEFQNEKDASKYKKVIEGLRKKGECTISYSFDVAHMMIEKAVAKELIPAKEGESMFLMDKGKEVVQCRFGQQWNKLTFAPPQFVTNSQMN